MATTQEIIEKARDLGKLIQTHAAAQRFQDSVAALQADQDAQRDLNDFNRKVQTLAERQAQGQPVTEADRTELEKLQKQVIMNPVLSAFQMAQMDYVDLMRQVDEALSGGQPQPQPGPAAQGGAAPGMAGPGVGPGGSPGVNPGVNPGGRRRTRRASIWSSSNRRPRRRRSTSTWARTTR